MPETAKENDQFTGKFCQWGTFKNGIRVFQGVGSIYMGEAA